MRTVTVRPDGTWSVNDCDISLTFLQEQVGGYIEAIGADDWCGYINEEGKLEGLPVNVLADSWARVHGWVSLPGDVLVGPVVFTGYPDDDGEDTALPSDLVEDLATYLGFMTGKDGE